MKLTKAMIGRIELPTGKSDAIYFDEDDPGFGLRIRAGGKRTWIVQYRIGAKQRRVTLGTVNALDPEKARKAARDRLAQVTLGGGPQADKLAARAKAKVTLGAIVDKYLNARGVKLRPKTFDEAERYLRKHWRSLHGLPLHRIERRDVAARLREIISRREPAPLFRRCSHGLLVKAMPIRTLSSGRTDRMRKPVHVTAC